ncbi:MAG: hypothetical protein OHK93_005178 [Ramalina farinacea]|uniref:Uncharacterized protein n=1 Tax=Ramalina farinacea TaxID=258253 RepID=A0AA43QXC2_9LECA|nr:hypothetical protein [Ramalina farinacea]
MPPPAIDTNRDGRHLVPRGLSGPTQGVVIGTLVGSFVFFGLLIWLYHCVNEDKGAYSSRLYYRPPSPPRRLRDLGPPSGGVPPQGRSYSLSPPRAPRSSGGAASACELATAAGSSGSFTCSSPVTSKSSIPTTGKLTAPATGITATTHTLTAATPTSSTKNSPNTKNFTTAAATCGTFRAIPPRDLGPSALQLERERDLALRMAEQNERERSRRPAETASLLVIVVCGVIGADNRHGRAGTSRAKKSTTTTVFILLFVRARDSEGGIGKPCGQKTAAATIVFVLDVGAVGFAEWEKGRYYEEPITDGDDRSSRPWFSYCHGGPTTTTATAIVVVVVVVAGICETWEENNLYRTIFSASTAPNLTECTH